MRTASLLLTASVALAWSSPIERNNDGGAKPSVSAAGEGDNAAGSALTEGARSPRPSATGGTTAAGVKDGKVVPVADDPTLKENQKDDSVINDFPLIQEDDPSQVFDFMTPTVDYQPPDLWTTSRLQADAESGPANVSVSVAGSGMEFTANGNPNEMTIYVNGTAGDQLKSTEWGKNAQVSIKERKADHAAWDKVIATVTGLNYDYYVFTLGSSGKLTFDEAKPETKGERFDIARADHHKAALDSHIKKEGDWQGAQEQGILFAESSGVKLTITPPGATAMLELRVGNPHSPFANFRVTIDPPPLYGPAVQEYHPNLKSAGAEALLSRGRIPVYHTLLNPNFDYTVVIDVLEASTAKPFHVNEVTYYP